MRRPHLRSHGQSIPRPAGSHRSRGPCDAPDHWLRLGKARRSGSQELPSPQAGQHHRRSCGSVQQFHNGHSIRLRVQVRHPTDAYVFQGEHLRRGHHHASFADSGDKSVSDALQPAAFASSGRIRRHLRHLQSVRHQVLLVRKALRHGRIDSTAVFRRHAQHTVPGAQRGL